MPNIQTLIRVVEIKTKPKDQVELAVNLTRYYFEHLYPFRGNEDSNLLQKKMELFCIYIMDFLLHPRKRFKAKKVFREIDKMLRKWKRRRFKKWLSEKERPTYKDICLKKKNLDMSCFWVVLCLL